jgi:hypothetical protein
VYAQCGVFCVVCCVAECDTFVPPLNREDFLLLETHDVVSERDASHQRLVYQRRNVQELQYLRMIQDILAHGDTRSDRTGVGTISRFGCQMRFDLRHSFPLLTTKRVFWRAVAEELLWFISGSTDGKLLSAKGIKVRTDMSCPCITVHCCGWLIDCGGRFGMATDRASTWTRSA